MSSGQGSGRSKSPKAASEKTLSDQVLDAMSPDTKKTTRKCFTEFAKWTDQLNLSDLNYGTARNEKQILDSLRDQIEVQKQMMDGIAGVDATLDPLFALDVVETTHRASTQGLMLSIMPSQAVAAEVRVGLMNASLSCDAAHTSLVKYIRSSIALR